MGYWITKDGYKKVQFELDSFHVRYLKNDIRGGILFSEQEVSVSLSDITAVELRPNALGGGEVTVRTATQTHSIRLLLNTEELQVCYRALTGSHPKSSTKPNVDIISDEKVYLSRKNASRRKVENEHEVEGFLNEKGFVTVYNEDYSFQDLVSLYQRTKYLVSVHGAGLTNMLFMNRGSHVLEL